jgi:hypothetical protein
MTCFHGCSDLKNGLADTVSAGDMCNGYEYTLLRPDGKQHYVGGMVNIVAPDRDRQVPVRQGRLAIRSLVGSPIKV